MKRPIQRTTRARLDHGRTAAPQYRPPTLARSSRSGGDAPGAPSGPTALVYDSFPVDGPLLTAETGQTWSSAVPAPVVADGALQSSDPESGTAVWVDAGVSTYALAVQVSGLSLSTEPGGGTAIIFDQTSDFDQQSWVVLWSDRVRVRTDYDQNTNGYGWTHVDIEYPVGAAATVGIVLDGMTFVVLVGTTPVISGTLALDPETGIAYQRTAVVGLSLGAGVTADNFTVTAL